MRFWYVACVNGAAGKESTFMLTDEQTTIVIVAAAIVLAIAVIAFIAARASRKRHSDLKARFGPEYDRAVQEYGSVANAERELAAREKRVHKQKLRPLADADRTGFLANWRNIQARFVDDPSGAVQAADALIADVMRERGYAVNDFEERVADLSVEHASVVQHYRAAQVLAEANREGRTNTEELRQAFVHYRALFGALLEQPDATQNQLQEAHV
jgi:hypothetical protein